MVININFKVGIFYKDNEWGYKIWNNLLSGFTNRDIFKSWFNANGGAIYLNTGSIIDFINITSTSRSRYDRIYYQNTINPDIVDTIIKPHWIPSPPVGIE